MTVKRMKVSACDLQTGDLLIDVHPSVFSDRIFPVNAFVLKTFETDAGITRLKILDNDDISAAHEYVEYYFDDSFRIMRITA